MTATLEPTPSDLVTVEISGTAPQFRVTARARSTRRPPRCSASTSTPCSTASRPRSPSTSAESPSSTRPASACSPRPTVGDRSRTSGCGSSPRPGPSIRPLQITGLWNLLQVEQVESATPDPGAAERLTSLRSPVHWTPGSGRGVQRSFGPPTSPGGARAACWAAGQTPMRVRSAAGRALTPSSGRDHRARRGHLRAVADPGRRVRRRRCATSPRRSSPPTVIRALMERTGLAAGVGRRRPARALLPDDGGARDRPGRRARRGAAGDRDRHADRPALRLGSAGRALRRDAGAVRAPRTSCSPAAPSR